MELTAYRDAQMYARPYQLRKDRRWTTGVHILRGDEVTVYTASNTWPTREDAVRHSLWFGCQIIDGTIVPQVSHSS